MIGVILWSDAADQKAVIWCEDQGDLAFLSAPDCVQLPDPFFDVGDVVEFDLRTERNSRRARNPSRVEQNWGMALSDSLQEMAARSGTTHSSSAQIIPFRLEPATRPARTAQERQQRRG